MEDKHRGEEEIEKAIEEEEEEERSSGGGDGEVSNQAVAVAVVLPYELLVVEVLTRLPAKSLMRFKCVSKLWCSTISKDPSFAKAHHARQPPGLFVTYSENDDSLSCFYATLPVPGGEKESFLAPHKFTFAATEVVNGLFCLYSGNRSWICNVSTREIRELPSSSDLDLENHIVMEFNYFLGFVSSRKEYKLLKLCLADVYSEHGINRWLRYGKLLTLGKDASWRRPGSLIHAPEMDLSGRPSVYIDGSLCCWHYCGTTLVVYNFEDDSVQNIDPPDAIAAIYYLFDSILLLQFGGHFALVRVEHSLVNQRLEVWKLVSRDSYKQGSYEWISHIIDLPCVFNLCDFEMGTCGFIGNLPLPTGDQMLLVDLAINDRSIVTVYSYDHAKGEFEKFVSWLPSPQVASIPRWEWDINKWQYINKLRVFYYEEDITPLDDLVISNKDSSLIAASCTNKKKRNWNNNDSSSSRITMP